MGMKDEDDNYEDEEGDGSEERGWEDEHVDEDGNGR